MGLELVEIAMKVEDAFDIELEEGDWQKIRTPRDLIDAAMAKAGDSTTSFSRMGHTDARP
jgi:hypothetical protein